jgi:outer membrane autotransporter protein
MNHSRASFNRSAFTKRTAPSSGDPSFNEDLSNQVWAQPFFGLTNRRAKGDSAGYDLKTLGVGLGYDHLFNENFTAGLAMTLNRPDYRSGGVKSDNHTLTLAAYGLTRLPGELELNLALGRSTSDYSQTRQVWGLTYGAEYQGTAFRAGASLARPFALNDSLSLSPRLSYDYLKVKADGYRESAGPHALQVAGLSQNLHLTALGAELAWQSDGGLGLTGSLGGTRVAGDLTAASAAVFQADSAHPFLATGDALDKNILNVGLGLSAPLSQQWSLKADYRGDFSRSTSSHSGELAFNFQF